MAKFRIHKVILAFIGIMLLLGITGEIILYMSIYKWISLDAHPFYGLLVYSLLPIATLLAAAFIYSVITILVYLFGNMDGVCLENRKIYKINIVYACMYLLYYLFLCLAAYAG